MTLKQPFTIRILLVSIFLGLQLFTFAQNVGINTTGDDPDPSAMLDVASSDKGILIPRVQLDDVETAAPITNPAVGLLIYADVSSAVTEGFYYWDGMYWQPFGNMVGSNNLFEITDEAAARNNLGLGSLSTKYIVDGTDIELVSNASGDIMYYNGTDWVRLAKGTNGQVLKINASGIPEWVTIAAGGDMVSTNNLSDVADASTARTNLGLGVMATKDNVTGLDISITDMQEGDLMYYNGTTWRRILNPAEGKILKYSSSERPEWTTPNFGDMYSYGNLSELTNTATARSNLELGDLATLDKLDFLSDLDNDTKIDVEKTTGDDHIRFQVDGEERYIFGSDRFEIVDAQNNLVIGSNAGESVETCNKNTMIGEKSGQNLATGEYNLFLGEEAGSDLVNGNKNTFVGQRSGIWNFGSNNTFLGFEAGAGTGTQSASSNTFIGYQAGNHIQNGSSNTTVGVNAGHWLYTGSSNTFIGRDAGMYFQSGGNNIAIGNKAGMGKTLAEVSASQNIMIGYWSGYNILSGQNNVLLGPNTGYSLQTGSNNVFIGYSAGRSETGSNKLYIETDINNADEPLIYGEFDNKILKVTGDLIVNNEDNEGAVLKIRASANLSHYQYYTTFQTQQQFGNITYTLPANDGDADEVLSTDGSGNLDWVSVGGNSLLIDNNLSDLNDAETARGNLGLGELSTLDAVSGSEIDLVGTENQGDMMYYNGIRWERLIRGSDTEVLRMSNDGGDYEPYWDNINDHAKGAEDFMRVVRGVWQYNGSTVSGDGFSVNRSSTGVYDISFLYSFDDQPAVNVDIYSATATRAFVNVTYISTTMCRVQILDFDGSPVDHNISFTITGTKN